MAGGGRPGVAEEARNLARAHLAVGEIQADQDSAARSVGERGEDGVVGVLRPPKLIGLFWRFEHGAIFSDVAKFRKRAVFDSHAGGCVTHKRPIC